MESILPDASTEAPVQSSLIRITDQEFAQLVNFMKSKYGIDLTRKRVLVEGRLTPELRHRGIASFQAYIDLLLADTSGVELTKLLNKLTTNLSYFLRENEHFEFLQNTILPHWDKTSQTHDLRIWSAGCSTGQEAYTTQMVIHEYFGARKSAWETTILATDISSRVLNHARAGIYTADDLKDMPAIWKQKYFTRNGTSFQISQQIRQNVVFRPANLMAPFQFRKKFDLIFCRNVMIYFDAETKAKLVKKFFDWTAPGGYLFIGHSESLNSLGSEYTYIRPAIYQKKG